MPVIPGQEQALAEWKKRCPGAPPYNGLWHSPDDRFTFRTQVEVKRDV